MPLRTRIVIINDVNFKNTRVNVSPASGAISIAGGVGGSGGYATKWAFVWGTV